jgi:hypothetical protein
MGSDNRNDLVSASDLLLVVVVVVVVYSGSCEHEQGCGSEPDLSVRKQHVDASDGEIHGGCRRYD